MALRSSDQITLTDLTDGLSVILSSEAHAFPGSTSAAIAGSHTTRVSAYRGSDPALATVDPTAIVKPANVTVSRTQVGDYVDVTITVSAAVTSAGVVDIPVVVDGLTIWKRFSFSIAFTGATGSTGSTGGQGPKGDTGTAGADAVINGLKNESHAIVTTAAGAAVAASTIQVDFYGYVGATRAATTAAVTGLPTGITVGTNTAGTASADGVLTLAVASGATMGGADSGVVTVNLTTGGITRASYFSWAKAKQGATGGTGGTGAAGADAVTLEVTSSAGLIFKNNQGATTLTAKVFKGGVEQAIGTGGVVAGLGTVKWYKDGVYQTGQDGATFAVSAGQVTDRSTYEAKLEY